MPPAGTDHPSRAKSSRLASSCRRSDTTLRERLGCAAQAQLRTTVASLSKLSRLIAPPRYRFEVFDRDFFGQLSQVGLRFRRVWPSPGPWAGSGVDRLERERDAEGGGESEGVTEGDATPCGWGEDTMEIGAGFDLFPEQQVMIFEIRKNTNV